MNRKVAKELNTPRSFQAVTLSLNHLGGIEAQRGELCRAREQFDEALELQRHVAQELDKPDSRQNVFEMEEKMKVVKALIAGVIQY